MPSTDSSEIMARVGEGSTCPFAGGRCGLLTDQRGAVMVLGVVMAALMVGVLWHLVGVGDAIIYRERMQEAADATAFESAVWHARTMNLLVVLNIIMSAILAFLAMWRLAELLVGLAAAVVAILCFIPGLQGLASLEGQLVRLEEWLVEKDPKVAANVEKWLIRVSKAEKVVSTVAPALNLGMAAANNTTYYGRGSSVDFAVPVSASIVPSVETKAWRPEVPYRMNLSAAAPAMPVQSDSFEVLCGKAGAFVPKQFAGLMDRFHVPNWKKGFDLLGSVLGKITQTFTPFFCGMGKAPSAIGDPVDELAKKTCDQEKAQYEAQIRLPDAGTGRHRAFEYDKCVDRNKDAINKKQRAVDKAGLDNRPAKVWDFAANGTLALQVWSIVHGSPRWSYGDDEEVALAAPGAAPQREDAMDTHWAVAQAEYYFETKDPWIKASAAAMWTIGWKARLRRVHDPVSMSDPAGAITAFVTPWLVDKWVKKAVEKYTPIKVTSAAFDWLQATMVNSWWSADRVKKTARGWIDAGTHATGVQDLGSFIMDRMTGNGKAKVIH